MWRCGGASTPPSVARESVTESYDHERLDAVVLGKKGHSLFFARERQGDVEELHTPHLHILHMPPRPDRGKPPGRPDPKEIEVLAPDIADAVRYGLDAKLLNEASDLDPAELNHWLDTLPNADYASGLKVHAHLLAARPALAERSAR